MTTRDGRETNIGKDCGKNHFSVDFEAIRRSFDRDLRNAERRERLGEFQTQIRSYLYRISQLREAEYGADWVYKTSRALVTRGRGLPEEIIDEISRMVRAKSNQITKQREANKQEIENLEAIEGRKIDRPHYISEKIGTLNGLAVLYPENDLRAILIIDIAPKLKEIAELQVETLSEHDLAVRSKWAGELDTRLEGAQRTVREGIRLLRKDNVAKLGALLEEKEDKRLLSTFVQQLPD